MKILCDRHHMSLTDSLILLFQKRLGWELYFQKGMEWYPEFWALQPFESTAVQYLERELEGLPGISLEEFKNTKFDVLLCSIPQHIQPFKKLIELYQPEAKLILQIGNMWSLEAGLVKNIMASAKIERPSNINFISYHQEFPLDIFYYEPVKEGSKKIYSFINCLNTENLYKKDWDLFLDLEKLMPDWEFKSFGGQCRDGAIWDRKELADKMREATYIFMCKSGGDGFGHNIFSAAAVGRPLIVRKSDYVSKLAEPLINEVTSITVDHGKPETIANILRNSWGTESYTPKLKGEAIYDKFKKTVDFEAETEQIKEWLQHLL